MTISINDNFPNQELRILIDGEVQNVNSTEYVSGKKIVLVGFLVLLHQHAIFLIYQDT